MNDGYRILQKMKQNDRQKFALATIIAVDGSSYRHPGAKMLIGEDGSQYGTISAGCLEEDLLHQSQEVIQSRRPKTLIYDLRSDDDLSWGQGAGCNGCIKVYVEPCEWGYKSHSHNELIWSQVESLLNLGHKVVSARRLSNDASDIGPLFYAENGSVFGDTVHISKEKIVPELRRFLTSDTKIKSVQLTDAEGEVLFELYEPREQLYVFGAGPDIEPIARLASDLDFYVTIIDPRSDRCNERNFPTADKRIIEHPESYLQNNPIPVNSCVLIMTHSFQRDRHILRKLIHTPPRYLGVLGSRLRTERLLFPDLLPDWLHSPVGLSIGAEGPDEISVSIMAELLKIRNIRKKQI
jgi:xanthine dehydrogenase accessory factor